MTPESSETWYLKKHGTQEVFGPVRFSKLQEWAQSAQISPQDLLSTDQEVWTRPPMLPELEMDWLVQVSDDFLYGPTTVGTLVEFLVSGEISSDAPLINCVSGEKLLFHQAPFAKDSPRPEPVEEKTRSGRIIPPPVKGGIRLNLQKRVRELEHLVLAKQRKLNAANEKIARLEARLRDAETRLREVTGFRPPA